MILKGSCHCQAVSFTVESKHPYPFNLCYCSICRKTAGGGGYAINLSGDFQTLHIQGKEHISVYQARLSDEKGNGPSLSPAERSFCKKCATTLWVWDPRWPELVHPFASAIDTELPKPPERTHLMLGSKAGWIDVKADPNDKSFDEYPDESIAHWHQRLHLEM
ncbi:MAG: GFA family protein [Proteobacteria bacterium]|nr:GFA family protein [Pseudomonadota bacterium]